MNLQELKTKLGDKFEDFKCELPENTIRNKTHELFGVTYEVIREERDDSDMELVIKIDENYFSMVGAYDSWNGTSWEFAELVQVEPIQVTTTEYKRI